MIQCQICQVANEDEAQFCRECGGRLTPAKSAPVNIPAPQAAAPAPQIPAQAANRPKLRSPLFGGGDEGAPDDDDLDDSPALNKAKSKGLRSPLLGGADGDEDLDEPRARDSKPKGGLRSPIFGGGGESAKNKEHKSTFPHRSHEFEHDEEPRPAAKLEAGRHQAKGLRSPLLGGDDFDPEESFEDPGIQGKAGGQVKAHHRLRSPVLGGADDYEDEIFDEVDDVDDPNVLRSPLLAVKTPRPKPAPAAPAASATNPAPPAPIQQQSSMAPQQPLPTQQPLPGYQGSYVNGPQAQYPPVAPSSAPSYEPKPAPSPTSSQFSMPAQATPGPQPYQPTARPAAPAPVAPAPYSPPPAPDYPAAAAPTESERKGMRGSRLLGDSDNNDDDDLAVGPRDRRSKSRERRMSRPDRRSSALDIDDDDDVLGTPMRGSARGGSAGMGNSAGSATANPMAPLLMASAAVALICKIYIFLPQLGAPDLFTKYLPSVVDQVSTMAVLLCLIMFALKSSQRQ